MINIKKIQELIREKTGLDLTIDQILKIHNIKELLNCIKKGIPIEFEWSLVYEISIYSHSSEGARSFVEGNLNLNDFRLIKISWNPSWQSND